MIFSADSCMEIRCHMPEKAHVCLNVDGNNVYSLSDGDKIEVVKSPNYVEIIDINGGSFFNSVNSKLMRPLKDFSEQFGN
jgi:NAD+ kinase